MEYIALVAMLVTLGVVIEMRFRVAGIVREIRSEARTTHEHLGTSLQRIDMLETATVQALKESMEGHPRAARETLTVAAEAPKPHRHQWVFSSSEQTNGERVKFYTCGVPGCRDVQREVDD